MFQLNFTFSSFLLLVRNLKYPFNTESTVFPSFIIYNYFINSFAKYKVAGYYNEENYSSTSHIMKLHNLHSYFLFTFLFIFNEDYSLTILKPLKSLNVERWKPVIDSKSKWNNLDRRMMLKNLKLAYRDSICNLVICVNMIRLEYWILFVFITGSTVTRCTRIL